MGVRNSGLDRHCPCAQRYQEACYGEHDGACREGKASDTADMPWCENVGCAQTQDKKDKPSPDAEEG